MNKIFKILIYSITMFLISFVIIEYGLNNLNQDYQIYLSEDHEYYNSIVDDKEYWINIIDSKGYDVSYDVYDSIKVEDSFLIIDGRFINYDTANKLLRAVINNGITSSNEAYAERYSVDKINNINPYIISGLLSIIVCVVFCFVIKNDEKIEFKIFTKNYWITASKENKKVKNLTFMALLLSLQLISKFIPIPSGFGDLGIGIAYLFLATNCMLFGPVAALMIGATGDVIGHFISPSGTFYFGYTLNAMIAAFMYGICFYKTKITFTKVLISRIVVNLFVNVVLGTLWFSQLFNLTDEMSKTYMLYISLPKNLFYLIPQSIVLFLVIKSTLPIYNKYGYVEEQYLKTSII